MAFENVTVQLQVDGGSAASTWRQDVTLWSVITCSLSNTIGVNTFHWWLQGRPEGSAAGGAGPEPVSLGVAATATFTVDLKGTYIVWCEVNSGQPNVATIRGGCGYLETFTNPDGRALRLLGGMETDEDIADPTVKQGWIKMLNRWLRQIAAGGGGGDFPGYYPNNPYADGVGDPGESWLVSRGDHRHPVAPTISEQRSYLFTALVPNPLDEGQVACVYTSTGEANLFSGLWTEGPTGTWTRDVVGPLLNYYFDGVSPDAYNTSGVSSMIGLSVLAWNPTVSDKENGGIYIIDDVGGHWEDYGLPTQHYVSTHAVLRRNPDYNQSADYTQGMAFQIQTGNTYGTSWMELTTATPLVLGTTELDWSEEETNPNVSSYALLTASQLSQASNTTVESTVTFHSGGGIFYQPLSVSTFETQAGTPALSSIPAGNFTADIMAKVNTAATGDSCIKWELWRHVGTSYTMLFSYVSSALTSTYALKQISAVISAQTIAPNETLILCQFAGTTSTTDVTVTVTFNDAGHTSRISLPVDFAVGIGDHQDLTNRSLDVASDEDPCHPLHALGPGRLLLCSDVATVLAGVITMPANANTAVISSTGTFTGITTARWKDGSIVLLIFTGGSVGTPVVLQHGATVGEDAGSFFHYCSGPGAGGSLTFTAQPARVWFVYDQTNERWLLVGGPYL